MASWRVARSLDTLLKQLNVAAPRRSKVSDGSIGDAAHASRDSDHNPYLRSGGLGIVSARDFTHDPAGGLDCNKLAAALVASGDPRIKYVIWNRRIYTPGRGWAAYKGSNPHDKHLHLSVSAQPGWFDSTMPWSLSGVASGSTGSPVTAVPTTPQEGFFMALSSEQQDDLYRRVVKIDQWMDDSTVDPVTHQPRGFAQRIGVMHQWVTSSGNGIADRIGRLVTKLGA